MVGGVEREGQCKGFEPMSRGWLRRDPLVVVYAGFLSLCSLICFFFPLLSFFLLPALCKYLFEILAPNES